MTQSRSHMANAIWAVQRLRTLHETLEPPLVNHLVIGSPHIHAKHLIITLAFKDDAALAEAKSKGLFSQLRRDLLKLLAEEDYPLDSLESNFLDFVSETAVNEAGGPWIYFR